MALIYSDKYAGYIADTPNIHFIRCDGRAFYFDEVNSASMTNTANSLTITGGQGNYPLAYIETDKTLEMTFASSQFSMDMFEMVNATSMQDGDIGAWETKKYEVGEGQVITQPYEVQDKSVKIRGLEQGDAVAAGVFTVAITAATAEAAGSTKITFNEGDVAVGDTIRVTYYRRVVNAQRIAVKTTTATARGQVEFEYPVYSAGVDCTESAIKARLRLRVWRCRVTALPGFDTSYKSAATNSVTFAAMDPKRADGQVYEIIYEELDPDGNVVAMSESTVDWNA